MKTGNALTLKINSRNNKGHECTKHIQCWEKWKKSTRLSSNITRGWHDDWMLHPSEHPTFSRDGTPHCSNKLWAKPAKGHKESWGHPYSDQAWVSSDQIHITILCYNCCNCTGCYRSCTNMFLPTLKDSVSATSSATVIIWCLWLCRPH